MREVFRQGDGVSCAAVDPFQLWEISNGTLKIPAVMMGFGLPDDNLHAPNEKFHIANFHRGIESVIRMLELLGG